MIAFNEIGELTLEHTGTPRVEHAHYGAADPASDGCTDGLRTDVPQPR